MDKSRYSIVNSNGDGSNLRYHFLFGFMEE